MYSETPGSNLVWKPETFIYGGVNTVGTFFRIKTALSYSHQTWDAYIEVIPSEWLPIETWFYSSDLMASDIIWNGRSIWKRERRLGRHG